MGQIGANLLLAKALKSCPKSIISPNLVTLIKSDKLKTVSTISRLIAIPASFLKVNHAQCDQMVNYFSLFGFFFSILHFDQNV